MISEVHETHSALDLETALICLTTLLAMGGVVWRDVLTFEISFSLLGVAALGMVALIASAGHAGGMTEALGLALFMMAATVLVRVFRPGQLGQGDIWLMGFLGLAAGPDYAFPVLITFGVLSLLTAAEYSLIRGKKLFRSMFPLALPGMGAASVALALRTRDAMAHEGSALGGQLGIALIIILLGAALVMSWMHGQLHMSSASGGSPAQVHRINNARCRDTVRMLMSHMALNDVQGCRVATSRIPGLVSVTLVARDGSEHRQLPWMRENLAVMILFLRAEVHPSEVTGLDLIPERGSFEIDRRSDLLHPRMAGLRCTYRRSPAPYPARDLYLELTVLRDEETRSGTLPTGPKTREAGE